MTTEESEQLANYKIELLKVHEKSQESFEKQLSYISAGGLGLSIAFIEKIVKNVNEASCKFILVISWMLLGSTLVVNLISHLLSAKYTYKTMDEIENKAYSHVNASNRNKFINKLNSWSVGSLLLGVCKINCVTSGQAPTPWGRSLTGRDC